MKRSDLICENSEIDYDIGEASVHTYFSHGTKYTETLIPRNCGYERPGRYYTIYDGEGDVKKCAADILSSLISCRRALVSGLGNKNVCSDSLGAKALKYIPATAHLSEHSEFKELDMREVFVLETGVTGKTGIESSERIACMAAFTKAEAVIVIDSLACSETERLCSTIQITDTGIAPGSGVGNDRKALNSDSCGVPVIAVGVPTVIDLDSIRGGSGSGLMVTPRNIDSVTERFAYIIGTAVSSALNPTLTEEEIRSLII